MQNLSSGASCVLQSGSIVGPTRRPYKTLGDTGWVGVTLSLALCVMKLYTNVQTADGGPGGKEDEEEEEEEVSILRAVS